MVVEVFSFVNGMVIAFDEHGAQVPDYQGRREEVETKIRRDYPEAKWNSDLEWFPGQRSLLSANPPPLPPDPDPR